MSNQIRGTQLLLTTITTPPSQLLQDGAADGDVLTWNSTASTWEPQTPSGGGSTSLTIQDDGANDITGVDTLNFGTSLTVTDNGNGSVTIEATSGGGSIDVSDNGSTVVVGVSDINFSSNINVTDDTDGTVTIDVPDNWVDIGGDTLTGTLTSQDIVPEMTGATGDVSTRTLGTSTAWFAEAYIDELFVGPNSLYVNGKKVIQDVSDTINVTTDQDQSLAIKTTGIGDLDITSEDLIDISADGGLQLTVPSTLATKHLNVTNDSSGGNITFTTTGSSSQIQFNAVDEIDFTAPIIDLNGTVNLDADPQSSLEAATKQYVDSQVSNHTHAAGDVTSGTFADARIAETNVTQHEGAITITESQISDFGNYLTDIANEPLNDLSDVSAGSPTDGQVLAYNNGTGNWEPVDPSSGGSISTIDDIGDVDTTTITPTDGDVLTWNDSNSEWRPEAPPGGSGSGVSGGRALLFSMMF